MQAELARQGIIGSEYRQTYGYKSGELVKELQQSRIVAGVIAKNDQVALFLFITILSKTGVVDYLRISRKLWRIILMRDLRWTSLLGFSGISGDCFRIVIDIV